MKELGQNRYCGHSVLTGKVVAEWQDTAHILRYLTASRLSHGDGTGNARPQSFLVLGDK